MWKFLGVPLRWALLPVAAPLALTVGISPAHGAATTPTGAHRSSTVDTHEKCVLSTGSYQREVERLLGLPVDGEQSADDCRAIQQYQEGQIIVPADGSAGPITYAALYLDWALNHPGELPGCPTRQGRVACVDLNHQIMWVATAGKTTFAPVGLRSGQSETPTRTGWFKVEWRNRDHVSTLYDTPMPFSQFFSGGQAIHGVYGNIYEGAGSHGCVNLRYDDARRLWTTLHEGDAVYVWGRKPGT